MNLMDWAEPMQGVADTGLTPFGGQVASTDVSGDGSVVASTDVGGDVSVVASTDVSGDGSAAEGDARDDEADGGAGAAAAQVEQEASGDGLDDTFDDTEPDWFAADSATGLIPDQVVRTAEPALMGDGALARVAALEAALEMARGKQVRARRRRPLWHTPLMILSVLSVLSVRQGERLSSRRGDWVGRVESQESSVR